MKKYQQFIEDLQQRRADLKDRQNKYGQEYNEKIAREREERRQREEEERIREIELKLAKAEENP